MRAVPVHEFGGPDQLVLEEIPRPEPGPGEVLVENYAVGVLPVEWKIRQGLFRNYMPVALPYLPGSAIAGVVAGVGPGVSDFEVGQSVFGRANKGAYAEYATALAVNLAPKPAAVGFPEAATISGSATPAWVALFDNGKLEAGQRVLIHAAAGGVGLFAVQFARLKGATVIATAGPDNLAFVRSLGAQQVIDYTAGPFEEKIDPVDLVMDNVGGDTLDRSFKLVKPGGTLVSLLSPPDQARAAALGIRATDNRVAPPYPSRQLLQTIAELMAEGKVQTLVGPVFPLAAAAQAHALSQSGHGRGRIILQVAGS
jgi:NADPH:quinone reductase-like Zn-dependent oxidoreductase